MLLDGANKDEFNAANLSKWIQDPCIVGDETRIIQTFSSIRADCKTHELTQAAKEIVKKLNISVS